MLSNRNGDVCSEKETGTKTLFVACQLALSCQHASSSAVPAEIAKANIFREASAFGYIGTGDECSSTRPQPQSEKLTFQTSLRASLPPPRHQVECRVYTACAPLPAPPPAPVSHLMLYDGTRWRARNFIRNTSSVFRNSTMWLQQEPKEVLGFVDGHGRWKVSNVCGMAYGDSIWYGYTKFTYVECILPPISGELQTSKHISRILYTLAKLVLFFFSEIFSVFFAIILSAKGGCGGREESTVERRGIWGA